MPAVNVRAGAHTARNAVQWHERPVLLRSMHERVHQVAIRDRLGRIAQELQLLPLLEGRHRLPLRKHGLALDVVLSDHQGHECMVLKVVIQLVVERLLIERSKALGTRQLAVQREGCLQRGLLVRGAKLLAFIKRHALVRQLPRRQHVGHETQVALGGRDELVHDLGRDLEALAKRNRQHARANGLDRRLRKGHVECRRVQWLHLGVAPVVADADDGHLRLADQRVDRANAATVAA